jgi:hypothetical protein
MSGEWYNIARDARAPNALLLLQTAIDEYHHCNGARLYRRARPLPPLPHWAISINQTPRKPTTMTLSDLDISKMARLIDAATGSDGQRVATLERGQQVHSALQRLVLRAGREAAKRLEPGESYQVEQLRCLTGERALARFVELAHERPDCNAVWVTYYKDGSVSVRGHVGSTLVCAVLEAAWALWPPRETPAVAELRAYVSQFDSVVL